MTRSALHQQVRRTIRKYDLCPAGSRVLIGLSGGSDSVALALLLQELSVYGDFSTVALAHLNHRLRDTASRDEAFCRKFAERRRVPIVVEHVDVRASAQERGWSLEDAARRERYAFLHQVAATVGADRIAVGHTRDDQAETFLMKLMRGAGLAGLGGVYPVKGAVIRPLLDSSRAELRSYLLAAGESWVDDESNDDVTNPRNRVRHVVLPELAKAAGGDIRANLARAALIAREDAEYLERLAAEQWDLVADAQPAGLQLDVAALASLAPALGRRIVLRALRQVAGEREVTQPHVDAVLGLIERRDGGLDVPGGRVELRAGKAVLIQQKAYLK